MMQSRIAVCVLLFGAASWACGSSDASKPAAVVGVDAGPTCPELSHETDGTCTSTLGWNELSSGPEARDHHATFLFANDVGATLYVSGGIDEKTPELHQDLWFSHVDQDGTLSRWSRGPAPPAWQTGHGVDVAGDHAYLVSGKTFQDRKLVETPKVFSLKLATDGTPTTWREEKPLPKPRFHGTTTAVDRWIFAIGGLESQPGPGATTIFRAEVGADGVLSDWAEATPLPEARTHHATVAKGRRLYVLGGLNGAGVGWVPRTHADGLVAEVDASGELGAWQRIPLPFATSTDSAVVGRDHIYLLGGLDDSMMMLDTVRRAPIFDDGTLGDWEPMASLPFARAHVHHTPFFRDTIFSVAGNIGDHSPTNKVVGGRVY